MKIHLSHILVKHQFEAEDLVLHLNKGQAFSELARKYSLCSSSMNGGDLGLIDDSKFDQDFSEAALALKVGQISKPVRTKFGYHLILRHK